MNKEQFLAMSLPYGLNGMVGGKSNVTGEFIYTLQSVHYNTEVVEVVGESDFHTEKFKPILHPLSDLTKEIEHKGERFVPIVKLAKMIYQHHDWRLSSSSHYAVVGNGYMTFEYDYGYNCFLCDNSAQLDQLKCLFKAIEWHFDLFGWIDKGDAIDVNSLSENPYK